MSKTVVLALPDFAPDRLLCLVQTLEAEYKRPDFVYLRFFSSAAEARRCFPMAGLIHRGETCPHQHAEYSFNARRHEQYISLHPMGSPGWGGEYTTVNLPAATLRPCRLEIERRCFLEIETPDYSDETLAALISAKILVAGTISRDGHAAVAKTEVAEAHDARGKKASADALVQATAASIRTWRLEPSGSETPFRITFEFLVTDDLSDLSLEFQLPQRIFIRGKPSLKPITVKGDGLKRKRHTRN